MEPIDGASYTRVMARSRRDLDEPTLTLEVIERRRQPRGVVRALTLHVPADGESTLDAVEASSHGFFARVDDPEAFGLGDVLEVEVRRGRVRFRCDVEVIRKSVAPRRGVALRITRIAPAANEALVALLNED
jgi:hypothetical protein